MAKDHLLQIVKSLNEDEKRVMNKHVKETLKKPRPFALELYTIYNKLLSKCFSDQEIKIELQKILKRKISMHKNIDNIRLELKEKLQTVMLNYLPTDKIENKVFKNAKIIEIFISRNLYEEAQLLINKIKKKAIELDLNKIIVDLIDWELYLLGKQSENKDLDTQRKLIEDIKHYQFLYALELRLKNTYRQLNLIVQKDVMLKKKESITAFKAVYEKANLTQFPVENYMKDQHVHIVTWYHRIQNVYWRTMGELSKAFKYGQTFVNYFDDYSHLKKNFEAIYIKSICGFTRTCFLCDKPEALGNSLEKIRQLYNVNSDLNILEITCDIGIIHYLDIFQYEKAIELTHFMEQKWNIISTKFVDGQLLYFCKNNVLLFWVLDDQTKFKYWLQTGLKINRSHKGREYYFGIRMFELINDLEQEQWDGFENKIKSLQRTLQNNQNLNAFKKIVLNHFKKLYAVQFSNQTFALKQSMKDELQFKTFQSLKEELQNSEFNSEYINYDEILLWCKSHLQNKSIKEVFEAQDQK